MEPLASFVLIGTILSTDSFLSTVEFNLNPATNGGPSIAVLPNKAIPCDIKIGKKIYIVKNDSQKIPVITCEKEAENERR
jgi:hypothetical protein